MEGSATFTIATSRTTMNWTTHSSARASHLRRSGAAAAPVVVTCISEVMLKTVTAITFDSQVIYAETELTGIMGAWSSGTSTTVRWRTPSTSWATGGRC